MINTMKFFKYKFIFILFFIFALILFNKTFANSANDSPEKLSKCITCHTATGNSTTTIWPKLAEQHASYMLKQLIEFKKGKEGKRYDPTMVGMLQGTTEEELIELSNYFSKQILERKRIKVNKSEVDEGKKIYLYGDKDNHITACIGCHGVDGTGNKLANYPSLKLQHKDYISIQLKKFRSKDRTNDVNEIMQDIASNMTDKHISAVASYISILK